MLKRGSIRFFYLYTYIYYTKGEKLTLMAEREKPVKNKAQTELIIIGLQEFI